eukprot:403364225
MNNITNILSQKSKIGKNSNAQNGNNYKHNQGTAADSNDDKNALKTRLEQEIKDMRSQEETEINLLRSQLAEKDMELQELQKKNDALDSANTFMKSEMLKQKRDQNQLKSQLENLQKVLTNVADIKASSSFSGKNFDVLIDALVDLHQLKYEKAKNMLQPVSLLSFEDQVKLIEEAKKLVVSMDSAKMLSSEKFEFQNQFSHRIFSILLQIETNLYTFSKQISPRKFFSTPQTQPSVIQPISEIINDSSLEEVKNMIDFGNLDCQDPRSNDCVSLQPAPSNNRHILNQTHIGSPRMMKYPNAAKRSPIFRGPPTPPKNSKKYSQDSNQGLEEQDSKQVQDPLEDFSFGK